MGFLQAVQAGRYCCSYSYGADCYQRKKEFTQNLELLNFTNVHEAYRTLRMQIDQNLLLILLELFQ